jgi:PST family polysaccharide transporter
LREATRYFGPVEWGPITVALAWFSLFAVLGGLGVATLAMREVARPDTDPGSAFGRALTTTAVVAICGAILSVAVGVAIYWGKSETLAMVFVLAPGIPMMALFVTIGSVLAGRGRSDVRAVLDLTSSVLLLVATLLVVDHHLRFRGFALAYLGYLTVSCISALSLATRFIRPKFGGAGRGLWSQIRAAAPLGQCDILSAAYARADSLMIFFIRGNRAVALYGLAYQIASFLFVVPSFLSNALLPDFMGGNDSRRRFLARRGFDVILTVALPLPLFGVLFARPFVVWISGARFAGAGPLLSILVCAAAIALMNGYLFQMAVFAGAERGLWRTAAVGTVSNVATNAIAVTFWGATGAAYVMILSETVGLLMYWRIYRTRMANPLGRRYPLSVVVASLGLVAIWWVLHVVLHVNPGIGLGMLPRAFTLAALYGVLLWSVTTITRRLARRKGQLPSSLS